METEPVDVQGVKQSFTLMVPIAYRGTYTSLKEQKTVEVRVAIVAAPIPPPAAAPASQSDKSKDKARKGKP